MEITFELLIGPVKATRIRREIETGEFSAERALDLARTCLPDNITLTSVRED